MLTPHRCVARSLVLGVAALAVAVSGILLVFVLGAQPAAGAPFAALIAFWWLFAPLTIAAVDVLLVVPGDLRAGFRVQARIGVLLCLVAVVLPLSPLLLAD